MSPNAYADDSAEDGNVDDDDDATTHGVQILFLFLCIAAKSARARSTAAIHPWADAAVPSVLMLYLNSNRALTALTAHSPHCSLRADSAENVAAE